LSNFVLVTILPSMKAYEEDKRGVNKLLIGEGVGLYRIMQTIRQ